MQSTTNANSQVDEEEIGHLLPSAPEEVNEQPALSVKDFARMNGVSLLEEPTDGSSPSVELPPEPEQVITQKQTWQQPWPKAAIVGGGMLALVGTLGGMVQGSLNSINTPAPKSTQSPTAKGIDPQDKEDSVGNLKAKNALTTQSYELSELNQQHKAQKKPTATAATSATEAKPGISDAPVAQSQPSSQTVVYRPAPTTLPREERRQPIATTTTRQAQRLWRPKVESQNQRHSPTLSYVRNSSPISPQKEVDPMQQWEMAATLGTYGSSEKAAYAEIAANDKGIQDSTATPTGGIGTPPAFTMVEASYTSTQNVLVGTRVSGKLQTPIEWSGQGPLSNQKFLIQLTEPMLATNNSVVLPKGAYIVAQVTNTSNAGSVQMSAISALVDGTERTIPSGAVMILGKGGKLLKASLSRSSSVGSDLGTALLNGVSTSTELINRPESQTSFGGYGNFSSTTTNRRSNLLAGFAQGIAGQMVQIAQNRRQESLQRQDAQKVFVIEQDTSVQLFVNQSVAL